MSNENKRGLTPRQEYKIAAVQALAHRYVHAGTHEEIANDVGALADALLEEDKKRYEESGGSTSIDYSRII